MNVVELAAALDLVAPPAFGSVDPGDVEVLDVNHDSRRVGAGSLFCAVRGANFDGHDYLGAAVAAGATALLVDRADAAAAHPGVVVFTVDDVRRAMPAAAAAVHGHPSERIPVFGITGTNGKTTTTQLLASIARHIGVTPTVVGTLDGAHTTPESTEWQRLLRRSVDDGAGLVAAEISSHALAQYRSDATTFAVAAFSNLTADHLDFHGDMDRYFEAKARLFDGRAIHELINVDDEWGRRLFDRRPDALPVSLDHVTVDAVTLRSSEFQWRGHSVSLGLPGRMNVANALMAAEAALALGFDPEGIAAGLSGAPGVAGRMQVVPGSDADLTVVVDYSHTPDSIERALATLRRIDPAAEITIVFGCGGDRDRAKRPLMGAAAERGSDRVVVTSDNPRSEDPDAIIAEALAGITDRGRVLVEADRRVAIRAAVQQARRGGVVLVAGKGHETTQTIGADVLPFDDVLVSAEVLAEVRS